MCKNDSKEMKHYIKTLKRRSGTIRFHYILFICCFVLTATGNSFAQITITPITNKNVKEIIEKNFLGDGVKIDDSHPIYYNNKTVIDNNQIGIFTNKDTSYSGNNIPIKSGLVLATDAVVNITSGGYEARTNPINGAVKNSPSLYKAYDKFVNNPDLNKYDCKLDDKPDESKFNTISVLDFWVIPSSCEMSFKYSFGSQEYHSYVCSPFNDFFGLFVDGPYNENDEKIEGSIFYENGTNIAIIPGTDEYGLDEATPVMINTVNAGGQGNYYCDASYTGDNTEYFIKSLNNNTYLNACTRRLETASVPTSPNQRYHVQIAICNINDQALQSAVFLEANSFMSRTISINHSITSTNDSAEAVTDGSLKTDRVFVKGCSTDTMIVKANYIADESQEPFVFYIRNSQGSSLERKIDYEFYKIIDGMAEEVPATDNDKLIIPPDESEVRYLMTFLHNPDKMPGTYDTLLFISTDCAGTPNDTIAYVMKEPYPLECKSTGGKTYCNDVLPQKDTISVKITNAVSYAYIQAQRGGKLLADDTLKYEYGSLNTDLTYSFTTDIMDYNDTASVYISVVDYCGRTYDTVIKYKVLGNNTVASVSSNYICEGDSVVLSCSESERYIWTSSPQDTTLTHEGNDKIRNPLVKPLKNTTYYIKTISAEGCVAADSVYVGVEKIIKAAMELYPKKTVYSSPEIKYTDISEDSFTRKWQFGDNTEDDHVSGYHHYYVDDTKDSNAYEVMLIVYNRAMCPDTAIDTVYILADFTIYVPNAFSPDNPEESVRMFGPKGSLLHDWEMTIYNRWGAKIFHGDNKMWDGKLESGAWAPQGTYVYDILYKDGKGMLQRKTGTFALLPNNGKK